MSDEPLGPDWWRARDGKWYPPPPPPQVIFAPAPPRDPNQPEWYQNPWAIIPFLVCCAPVGIILVWTSKWNRTAKIATTAVVGGLFVLTMVLGALNPSESRRDQAEPAVDSGTPRSGEATAGTEPDPADDFVSVQTSALSAIGCATVQATVHNNSDRTASYYMVIQFESSTGVRGGSSSGTIDDVPPGETITDDLWPACSGSDSADFSSYRVTTFRRTLT